MPPLGRVLGLSHWLGSGADLLLLPPYWQGPALLSSSELTYYGLQARFSSPTDFLKSDWNTAMLLHLHISYGRFCAMMAEMSCCARVWPAKPKQDTSSSLVLSKKFADLWCRWKGIFLYNFANPLFLLTIPQLLYILNRHGSAISGHRIYK